MTPEERKSKIEAAMRDCLSMQKFGLDHIQVRAAIGKLIDEAEELREMTDDSEEVKALKAQLAEVADVACKRLGKIDQMGRDSGREIEALEDQLAEANAKVAWLSKCAAGEHGVEMTHNPEHCSTCGLLLSVPATARTLLDEHTRYKKALEVERDSCDPRSEQSRLARLNEALSTPEPPKEKP